MTKEEFKEIANKLPHDCDMCIANGSATRCEHCDSENDCFIWSTSALKLIRAVWDACVEKNKSQGGINNAL